MSEAGARSMAEQRPDDLAKLRWRCRRGMRELDTLLQAFLETSYATLDEAQKRCFGVILDFPDPELHAYLLGRLTPEDEDVAELIARIRGSHAAQA